MTRLSAAEPRGHRDAVFGLCQQEARILLVRNERTVEGERRSLWDLPGGAVEQGESLGEALVREWREETGLACRVGALCFVVDGAKRRSETGPALYTWRAFAFAVTCEGTPRAGEGIDEARWVPLAEAGASLDAPYHGPVRAFLAGDRRAHHEVSWVEAPSGSPAPTSSLSGDLLRLLVLAAAAAVGDLPRATREAEAAIAAGVPVPRIEEALLQIVPYAGFPRAIAAFGAVRPLLGAHRPAGEDTPPCATGPETFGRVYGESAERVHAGLVALHPELAAWTQAFAYGRVLSRPALTLHERELLAVAILTALGRLDDPLLGHMRAAIRLGSSGAALREAIERAGSDVGPHAEASRLLARL